MGDNALTGLLPGGSLSLFLFSDLQYDEKWSSSELVTAGLIQGIQPSRHSEGKRRAVIQYVERLIQKHFNCQVCTFGSVPLKTYLPDGDIDLTTFSWLPHSSEVRANDLRHVLKREENNKHAKFCIKEVQIIHAEVQIVKCLVDNIVVDISFNQLGGLCTLCFLEEVDRLIGKDHLLKRSIILVKAWCYYESRILGAHHGLISTYALETLVLYIFNLFHASLRGPFEVLYMFLQFFSQFDWKHYCLSLWGPIHLSALHEMTAEAPRKDGNELLFSHEFLFKCSQVYGVSAISGQDFQGRDFSSKNMNVVDPLRVNNNLGRSVNRGNFFRICRAFAYGAKQIEKVLNGPLEELSEKLDDFFHNTRKHCNEYRPNAFHSRLTDVLFPVILRGAEDLEEAEDSGRDCEYSKSFTLTESGKGSDLAKESISTNAALNEKVEIASSADKMNIESRVDLENARDLSTHGNGCLVQCSCSPAISSRIEASDLATGKRSSTSFSRTTGRLKKNGDFMGLASDTAICHRGNIENARDLSSSMNQTIGFHQGQAQVDPSPPMPVQELDDAMSSSSSTQDHQLARNIHDSPHRSILRGDFEAYFLNLQACSLMVASHFYQPMAFIPSLMFPSKHMFEAYGSEGPGRPPTNGDINMLPQVFAFNYDQYLSPSFQGLSLQNTFALPVNGVYQGQMPKSHRGTGTYLPNLRSGAGNPTQPTHDIKSGVSSSKLSEWNGFSNQSEAIPFIPRYPHVVARPEGSFSPSKPNTRPERRTGFEQSSQENGYKLRSPKFLASTNGNNAVERTSQALDFKPFMFVDAKHVAKSSVLGDTHTPSIHPSMLQPPANFCRDELLTEHLQFGSVGSALLARHKKAIAHAGAMKDLDGLKREHHSSLKHGDYMELGEVTAKKALFNDSQQSPLKSPYELKEEDFPPLLSSPGETSRSAAAMTAANSTAVGWPHFQTCSTDSSTWSMPKPQRHVDTKL